MSSNSSRGGLLAVNAWVWWGVVALVAAAPSWSASPGAATSGREARDEAIRAIAWDSLSHADRERVKYVVRNASIYRRLPVRCIDCDPDLFTFLLRHPDVVVDVWRLMGVSEVTLERLSDEAFRGSDGAGTTGEVRYMLAEWGPEAHNRAVIYAEGAYEGKPFVKPIRAQSVLVLQSASVQETNGRHYITVRIDSFVHIEQMGVELVARTIQPWLNQTADRNLVETLGFVSTFSRTAERNPQGMQRLAARLETLDEPTRNELVRLCFRTARRYADNDPRPWDKPYTLAQRVAFPSASE